ncbi:MAG: OmpA family protein [Polyangiales bacterium]
MRTTTWNWLLAIALVGSAACGPSQEEYDAQVRTVAELRNQLAEATTQREALEARLNELTASNNTMSEQLRALGATNEQLQGQTQNLQNTLTETQRALEELRERERQAQARLATFRSLLERFRSMIESGRLRVRVVRNRMVVELPAGVLFDSGSDRLKPDGQQILRETASILRDIPDREFQVAGHTDNIPVSGRGGNWALSTARAVTVAQFLIDNQVPANRLSAAGYADTQPVADNSTDAGRQQNRRIEIALVPNLNELPDLSSLQNATATPAATPAPSATPAATPAPAPAAPAPR